MNLKKDTELTDEKEVSEDEELRERRGLRKHSAPLELTFASTSATSLATKGKIAETGEPHHCGFPNKFLSSER